MASEVITHNNYTCSTFTFYPRSLPQLGMSKKTKKLIPWRNQTKLELKNLLVLVFVLYKFLFCFIKYKNRDFILMIKNTNIILKL